MYICVWKDFKIFLIYTSNFVDASMKYLKMLKVKGI